MNKALDIPEYKQTEKDHACGPVCIGMVIDYLRKRRNMPLLNLQESLQIAAKTMNSNLSRKTGTRKEDMIRTIRSLECKVTRLSGDQEERLAQIRGAIKRQHPVILYCHTLINNKPYRHFILVTCLDKQRMYFNDPYPRMLNNMKITDFCGNAKRLRWLRSRWGIIVSSK